MKSDKYGERRGAAFGLAGVVMGFGISSLKQYGLVVTLQEALIDRCFCLHPICILFYFIFTDGILNLLFMCFFCRSFWL